LKYTETHKAYYNDRGVEIPSATTILKILNKPALVKWANYLGFKRQNVDDVLEETSKLGSLIHLLIEGIISKKYILFIPIDNIDRATVFKYLNNFFTWFNNNDIEPIFQEKEFVSELFGGTVDFYGKVNGKYTIVDFKTSKQIRLTMFIQLALYTILLELRGYTVEQVGIVLANDKNNATKFIDRNSLEPYIKFAYKIVDFYHSYYNLNEQTEWSEYIK